MCYSYPIKNTSRRAVGPLGPQYCWLFAWYELGRQSHLGCSSYISCGGGDFSCSCSRYRCCGCWRPWTAAEVRRRRTTNAVLTRLQIVTRSQVVASSVVVGEELTGSIIATAALQNIYNILFKHQILTRVVAITIAFSLSFWLFVLFLLNWIIIEYIRKKINRKTTLNCVRPLLADSP